MHLNVLYARDCLRFSYARTGFACAAQAVHDYNTLWFTLSVLGATKYWCICWTSSWLLMFNMRHVTGIACRRKPRLCRLCAGSPEAAHSQKHHRCREASGSLDSDVCLNGTRQGTRCNMYWCSTKSVKISTCLCDMFDQFWSYHIWSTQLCLLGPSKPQSVLNTSGFHTANCKMIETHTTQWF